MKKLSIIFASFVLLVGCRDPIKTLNNTHKPVVVISIDTGSSQRWAAMLVKDMCGKVTSISVAHDGGSTSNDQDVKNLCKAHKVGDTIK